MIIGNARRIVGVLNQYGSQRSFDKSQDPMGTATTSVIRTAAPIE